MEGWTMEVIKLLQWHWELEKATFSEVNLLAVLKFVLETFEIVEKLKEAEVSVYV